MRQLLLLWIVLLCLLCTTRLDAHTVILKWTNLPQTNLKGITLSYGPTPGHYTNAVPVGLTTSASLSGIPFGTTYFAARSNGFDGQLSAYSNEVKVDIAGDESPPTATITQPKHNSMVKVNQVVTIRATAKDADSAISRVEFQINGTLRCVDGSIPYTCSWKVPLPKGLTYQLRAKAIDTSNNVGFSQVIKVTSQ